MKNKNYVEYEGSEYIMQIASSVKELDKKLVDKAFEIADKYGVCNIDPKFNVQFWDMKDALTHCIFHKGKMYTFVSTSYGDYAGYSIHELKPLKAKYVEKLKRDVAGLK